MEEEGGGSKILKNMSTWFMDGPLYTNDINDVEENFRSDI